MQFKIGSCKHLNTDFFFCGFCRGKGSSLIYNTSARHERHECDTNATRVWHEWDMNGTSATQVRSSTTWTTRVRHKCYTNNTSATGVKNFDFGNDTSENIFSQPYNYYMASARLQGQEQFHSKNYLLEMLCSYAKMRLKKAPQKLNFVNGKSYIKKLESRL